MLESNLLLTNLLKIVCSNQLGLQKNMALDILAWIVSIRMTRYRSPKTEAQQKQQKPQQQQKQQQKQQPQQSAQAKSSTSFGVSASTSSNSAGGHGSNSSDNIDIHLLQMECIHIMGTYLKDFLKNCIILGNRSTAHKCVKIIANLTEYV